MKIKPNDNPSNNQEDQEIEIKLGGVHTCDPNKKAINKPSSIVKCNRTDIKLVENNNEEVIRMIRNEPLKGRMYFYEQCIKKNITISKNKIKELIKEIREELFPSKLSIILSSSFYKTEDDTCSQTFFQYQGETCIPNLNESNVGVKKSFIIFGSAFMLKQLEEKAWFVDATFSIVPTGFYQMITILVYNVSAKTYVPSAYILMASKHQSMYEMAFQSLKTICKGYKINVSPTHIMSDFEAALRNALVAAFPSIKLIGCYFHYCQCLWLYATKHGMKTGQRILLTKKLITLLKILPHLGLEERSAIFKEIKEVFKNSDNVYKEFLIYYAKNWLKSFSIDFDTIEGPNRLVRTNNICEQYNRRLKQKIQIRHPRLAILVTVLLEEEALFKRKILGSLSLVSVELFMDHSSVAQDDILPFSAFTLSIYKAKQNGCNLRSITNNLRLMERLERLCEKGEDFVFTKLKTLTEIDSESQNSGGNLMSLSLLRCS